MSVSNLKRNTKNALIGFFKRVESRPRRYDGAISTLYHKVSAEAGDYCIIKSVLDEQVRYLQDHGAAWYTATELAESISQCDSGNNICLTFDDGDLTSFESLLQIMEAGGKSTQFVIPDRINKKDKSTISWAQVQELDSAGVEIGSHSLTHPYLSRISNQELRAEIADSKAIIEDKLSKSVTSFAYPYGDYDSRVIEAVRDAGYRCAFTTRHLYAVTKTDPYLIPRFEPLVSLQQLIDLCEGRAHLFYRLLKAYLDSRDALKI